MSKYYIREAAMDPDNSADVFERGRWNEFGEPYCVLCCVTWQDAKTFVRINS